MLRRLAREAERAGCGGFARDLDHYVSAATALSYAELIR
jgi:hypothetical protein